jgi:hypothetical protein
MAGRGTTHHGHLAFRLGDPLGVGRVGRLLRARPYMLGGRFGLLACKPFSLHPPTRADWPLLQRRAPLGVAPAPFPVPPVNLQAAPRADYGFCHAAERRAEPSVCTGRFQDDLERHHFRGWVRNVTSLSDPDPKSLCSVSFTVPTRARSSQKGPSFSWAHPPARPQGPCVEGKVVVVCFSFRCRAFFSGDVL